MVVVNKTTVLGSLKGVTVTVAVLAFELDAERNRSTIRLAR